MRILLSNDDGVDSPGLAALRAAVDDMGEVRVVAPAVPQSAAGHAITLRESLLVRPARIGPGGQFEAACVTGRPADCVRLAIRQLLDWPPELVLSGINAGANVGVNVFYSGTVAAAAEAAMLGIPAVALSAELAEPPPDWPAIAACCRRVLDHLLAAGLAAGDLINVNLPARPEGPRGVRVARQSTAGLEDTYHRADDASGTEGYRLADEYAFRHSPEDTDVAALAEGFVTVTPLHVDMTNHDRLAALSRLRWQHP